MQLMISMKSRQLVWALFVAFCLTGCVAGKGEFKRGNAALDKGNYDQAVTELSAAVAKNSTNYEYRLKLSRAQDEASQFHKKQGDHYFEMGDYAGAQHEYKLAVTMDGSNFVAISALQKSSLYIEAQRLTDEAAGVSLTHLREAENLLTRALSLVAEYPPAVRLQQSLKQSDSTVIDGVELQVCSIKPITLKFKETKLTEVFEILTRLSGINFILDADIRDAKISLNLENATFAQSLELLLRLNKLDKKILNAKTIILYPKTTDKQKQFEDQLIQTFYLSNIDAKKAVNLLRTMLQLKKIYVHEELNAIVIRDTETVVRLAADILEANDRSDSEVVFDLELIEVNHTDSQALGLKLSNYSVGVGMGFPADNIIASSALQAGDATAGLIAGADAFKQLRPFYAIPTATFRLMKTQADSEVLANPRIRVRNQEKAKVHIGNREPVITVTINGDQTSENVQYVDVGVKLDIAPRIQLDSSIVTNLGLEVSNVSGRETTSNGTAVLTISTTNANTVLTLKDGEQTIIGGLIRGDKSTTRNKIPFLGDIPLIGALFNGTDKTGIKREILLSITPHIVKSITLPRPELLSIWSGGEDDLKYGRNFGSFASEYTANQGQLAPQPNENTTTAPSPSIQQSAADEGQNAIDIVEPEVLPTPTNELVRNQISNLSTSSTLHVRGQDSVRVGDLFTLSFWVEDVSELSSAPLYIRYDKSLFEFVSASEGDFLKQTTTSTIFTHTALKGNNQIIVGLKQNGQSVGSTGSGELFTLTFKARQEGEGMIKPIRLNFRDSHGSRLPVDTVGLKVHVRE